MAVAVVVDTPGATQELYDRTMEALRRRGVTLPVEGQILHLAGPYNGGWRTMDVWESREANERFFQEHLAPVFAETGVPPGQPQVMVVHGLYK